MAGAQESAAQIIQKSVAANQRDWTEAPKYDYLETDREGGTEKTSQVVMLEGSPYYRLVAIHGKQLSPEKQAEEQRKLDGTRSQRESETPEQKQKRIAEYKKERVRDDLMMQQLTQAFRFQLAGQRRLGPYTVWVLQATPRPDYKPPNREAQVLTGMRGTLWIDTKTYQWVRVEAQVVHPVSIAGFLARVEPGTRFELEKMPVETGVWLPKHFSMKAKARILGLIGHYSQDDETYFNYHVGKAQSSTPASGSTALMREGNP